MLNKRILVMTFLLAFLFLVGCVLSPVPPVIENQAPVIVSQPVTAVEMGAEYIYDVEATDADGDSLSYSLIIKPFGMAIDPSTGVINWSPILNQVSGKYHLVIVDVSDGALNTNQTFMVGVWVPIVPEPYIPPPPPPPSPIFPPMPPPPKTYTIVAAAGPGGSISPAGSITVEEGADLLFTITPDSLDIEIKDVLVDEGSSGEYSAGKVNFYTFVNVTDDHTIYATFKWK